MNRMNRQVEYGMMALKVLATLKSGAMISAKEIAESTGTPFDPMARVLQQMKQKGFINGEQGVQGGYFLQRDLNEISVHDFLEGLLGSTMVVKCIHEESECELSGNCNIKLPALSLNQKLEEFYKSLSMKEILL